MQTPDLRLAFSWYSEVAAWAPTEPIVWLLIAALSQPGDLHPNDGLKDSFNESEDRAAGCASDESTAYVGFENRSLGKDAGSNANLLVKSCLETIWQVEL